MRWASLFIVLFFAILAAPLPAVAQSDSASDSDARALFQQGREAYDAERFEEATRAFRRAYLLSPRYPLLYNIGQSELRAGNDALALDAFEGYLRQAPADDPNRSEVAERVRVLRAMGVTPSTARAEPTPEPAIEPQPDLEPQPSAEPQQVSTTTATVQAVEPTRDEGPGAAPWIVVGTGAAALVAGAVLMGVGVSEASRVTNAPDGSRWVDLEGSASSANVLWGVGIALGAVGLAAIGGGLAWALSSGSSEGGDDAASARLRVGPMSVAVEGEF